MPTTTLDLNGGQYPLAVESDPVHDVHRVAMALQIFQGIRLVQIEQACHFGGVDLPISPDHRQRDAVFVPEVPGYQVLEGVDVPDRREFFVGNGLHPHRILSYFDNQRAEGGVFVEFMQDIGRHGDREPDRVAKGDGVGNLQEGAAALVATVHEDLGNCVQPLRGVVLPRMTR